MGKKFKLQRFFHLSDCVKALPIDQETEPDRQDSDRRHIILMMVICRGLCQHLDQCGRLRPSPELNCGPNSQIDKWSVVRCSSALLCPTHLRKAMTRLTTLSRHVPGGPEPPDANNYHAPNILHHSNNAPEVPALCFLSAVVQRWSEPTSKRNYSWRLPSSSSGSGGEQGNRNPHYGSTKSTLFKPALGKNGDARDYQIC